MSDENIKEMTLEDLDDPAGGAKLNMTAKSITFKCPKCGIKTVHDPIDGLWRCKLCAHVHKRTS